MTLSRLAAASGLAALVTAAPLAAQLKAAPSGRATTEVTLSTPRVQGQPAPKPLKVSIDYGVPHARGREVIGALAADRDTVWRLGANSATTFVTEVDLDIGGTTVPKGTYTLFAQTAKGGWKLIVNKKTGEWGTEYDRAMDLARIPLQSRTLATPLESFTMWLIPGDGARGELRFAWGTLEHAVAWSAK